MDNVILDVPDVPFPEEPFLASEPVDWNLLHEAGCFTRFRARKSTSDNLALDGLTRAVAEFEAATNTTIRHGATISAGGTMTGLAYFDCLPERVKIISYLNEIGFLYDDFTEPENVQGLADVHKRFDYAMNPCETECPDDLATSLIMKKLFSVGVLECLEIDLSLGLDMMKSYSEQWIKTVDTQPTPYSSVDEFYRHRVRDSGTRVYWWMIVYGHGTRMTEGDFALLEPLLHIVERVFLATNDFYSWPKERLQPIDRITNAIILFMNLESLCEQDAMERLKQFIVDEETSFLPARESFCASNPNLAPHLKRLINMLEAAMAGFHYWAATCPRYNAWKEDQPHLLQVPIKVKQGTSQTQGPDTVNLSDPRPVRGRDKAPQEWGNGPREHMYLDKSHLMAPITYICSSTSKNVRSQLIDSINLWLKLPKNALDGVKEVINDLHHSSLILDDIQDNSALRRGRASAHLIFGEAQAINSATYMFVRASRRVHSFESNAMMTALLEELEMLFIGQSWELHWKRAVYCPTETEYFAMVDRKTGAMFRLIFRLMAALTETHLTTHAVFNGLATLLGRWYQVRDDYMNLRGIEYAQQKGLYEDLDEGKFSYPIVRCCTADADARNIILGLFRQNQLHSASQLPQVIRSQLLALMDNAGALEDTQMMVQQLQKLVEGEVGQLERELAETNPILRLIVKVLGNLS